MLNRIIEFSIRNKLIVGLVVLGLIGYGVYEVGRLPIDAVPDITDNQVQVITVAPALGAPDVERLITFPVEQANSNIAGLKQIRSFSRFGLSVVTIVFDDAADIYWARQQVTERLQQAQDQIPKAFGTPTLAPVTTGLGEIYQYAVRPKAGYEDRYSAMDLRTIQDWIVRRQLLGVKGVADVASFGGLLKQYEIAVDPARLKANGVTINEVFAALENNNQNTGGAYIEKGPTVLFIRSEGLVGNIDDMQNIVVKNLPGGAPLMIRDLAEVRLGNATPYGAMTYDGKEQVSGAVVMMLKGANSNEVIRQVKERVAQIQKTLPEGVVIDAFLDRTKMVNAAIGTVERNLMEGALIVVFVLVIFLGNLRAGLLVASIIPLSMLFAIILMNLFGVSGNLMSLGALDFGLIVDGAVIIVEAVMHRFTHSREFSGIDRLDQRQMDGEVKGAAERMMNSAVFGQMIILVVYLPIFTLQGIEGKMFKPMAQTVAFALLGAFILSLTYIPMMSALVLSKKIRHKPGFSQRMVGSLERSFRQTLDSMLGYSRVLVVAVLILLAAAVWVMTRLGGEFIPSLEEGDYAVETRVLAGSNLHTSIDAVSKASRILLAKFPEVEKIVGKTGSSEIPTDPMPIDASDMMVILKDKSKWTSAKTFPQLEAKMTRELEAIPGVTFGFQYPVQMRFNELMTGARQDVVCKIFGADLDTLASLARKLGDISNTVKGSRGLYVEAVTGMPQIVIRYNRGTIAQYGLTIADVNKVINMAFAGQSSGMVYEGERRFDLVVRLSGEQRKDLADVQNLLIPTARGIPVPLSALAAVGIENGPNQIQREDAQRRIVVGFNVRGRDVQSMVKELQAKVDRQLKLPPGYHITYGGAFENLEAARKRLSVAVPVSLVLIFLMLYFAFGSVRQGLLIYSAIPLSAIGGVFALAIRGMPFSISAGIGFIALFGVAVLNGIVLIAEFNRLRKEGMTEAREIVLEGTAARLRPVLMTAFVASLGFLPMALSNGAGAEVQRPLATVVIGGLLIATFLTLFLLPVLYIIFEKKVFMKAKKLPAAVVLLVGLLCAGKASAQTGTMDDQRTPGLLENRAGMPITLSAAVDTALKNNLSLKGNRLNAEYLKKLQGTAVAIPQTSATLDYGQINSAYADNKLSLSQTIRFPTVYARQRSLYEQEWKGGVLAVATREVELKKEVTRVYYNMLYLRRKMRLLLYTDSLFRAFLQNAVLRLEKGESNILEKTTAETQAGQIGMQLKALHEDFAVLQYQFQGLLNTGTVWAPADTGFRLPPPVLADLGAGGDTLLNRHPYLRQLEQQQVVNAAQLRLEKAKLSPDLFAAFSTMTMKGTGADDKVYSGSDRFQSFQVGIGLPIFSGAQRSAIAASRVNLLLAQNNYNQGLQALQTAYRQAVETYRKQLERVSYYERSALASADTIIATADRQFKGGQINYLDWVLLTNNAIAIRSEYVDAVRDLNGSIIDLNSFTDQ